MYRSSLNIQPFSSWRCDSPKWLSITSLVTCGTDDKSVLHWPLEARSFFMPSAENMLQMLRESRRAALQDVEELYRVLAKTVEEAET